MGDIKNWAAQIRGRWDWTRFGYESNFPRGCQFTDVDATVEFDGHRLLIEAKHYDGLGGVEKPPMGQRMLLRDEARLGKTVLVVYGCGVCDDPYGVYDVGRDELRMWPGLDKRARRARLKAEINRAMGVGVADLQPLPFKDGAA